MGKRSYHVTIHSRLPGRLSQKLGVEGESSPSFLPIFYKIHSFLQCEISSFYSPDEVGAITDVQSDNIHIIYIIQSQAGLTPTTCICSTTLVN
jgi:hypothetical protein